MGKTLRSLDMLQYIYIYIIVILLMLPIVLFVLLPFTASDYPFGIFQTFCSILPGNHAK